jgi:pimeloyl-ACP methyl ester carboxylesterase
MKEVSYIIVPGLGDHKPIFGWFYVGVGKRWGRKGLRTQIFHPEWLSAEPYEEKYKRLVGLIESEQRAGRGVVLIGVSAGDALAMLAMAQSPVPLVALISVCGFVRLKESDKHDSPYSKLSWYRAGDAAEKSLAGLSSERKSNILCLIPRIDRVVEPERQHIDGTTNVRLNAAGHLWGIVVALLWRHRTIQRFVNERI